MIPDTRGRGWPPSAAGKTMKFFLTLAVLYTLCGQALGGGPLQRFLPFRRPLESSSRSAAEVQRPARRLGSLLPCWPAARISRHPPFRLLGVPRITREFRRMFGAVRDIRWRKLL